MKSADKVVTNVTRMLERSGVPFSTASYPVDESDLSAAHAAALLGCDPALVYKTLVCVTTHGHAVFVIPAEKDLDLKKCAAAAGEKRAELLPLKELTPLTGYLRGGCSPIGMKKRFPTFLDEGALAQERIYVSAGKRGFQVVLSPRDLLAVTDGKAAPLTRGEEEDV